MKKIMQDGSRLCLYIPAAEVDWVREHLEEDENMSRFFRRLIREHKKRLERKAELAKARREAEGKWIDKFVNP